MTLKEIFDHCRRLPICERRDETEEYVEFVFYSKDITQWDTLFGSFLGPVLKAAGIKPSPEVTRLTEKFGGIWDDQTVFRKDFGTETIIAMFWPWKDQKHTTLKMFMVKK